MLYQCRRRLRSMLWFFLQMFNNAREYPNKILNLENNSGNSVFITCHTEDKDDVKEWIEGFNNTSVSYEEEIDRFTVVAEYDKAGWEVFWGSDNEVQFAVDIE